MSRSAAIGAIKFKWHPYVSGRFRVLYHTLWANLRHLGQFSGNTKPDGFPKTHFGGILKCQEVLQSELRNSNDIPTFRVVFMGYNTHFRPILGSRANFWESLNPILFVNLMSPTFWNVQKRCNWSYGIQMTALRFGPFSCAIAHASGQFSGTHKPDGFRKTHVVGVLKCPEALQSEQRNSNDVPTFWVVFMGYIAHASGQS
jgi:hypothetical protein